VVHIKRKSAQQRLRARPGLQQRSRESFEAVLDAAESLLSERLFENVGMAEIARRAGLAVGTAYQRFASKEALIPPLFDRHNAVIGRRIASLFSQLEAEPLLERRAELLVTFAVDYHVRYRGLLRTLTTFVRANPSVAGDALFREREALYVAVAHRLIDTTPENAPSEQLEAALFAIGVVNSVCREQVLFGDVSPMGRRRSQHRELKRRLAALVTCSLPRSRPPHSGQRQ
jgi:AcrR family transcriptional regulator